MQCLTLHEALQIAISDEFLGTILDFPQNTWDATAKQDLDGIVFSMACCDSAIYAICSIVHDRSWVHVLVPAGLEK